MISVFKQNYVCHLSLKLQFMAIVAAFIIIQPASGAENIILKRTVLALYNPNETENGKADTCLIHKYLEMQLNYLGLVVQYHDVNKRPLPEVKKYRAVIVWFNGEKMNKPVEYCLWLEKIIKSGTKVVVIGGIGAEENQAGKPTPRAILMRPETAFGLKFSNKIKSTYNPFIIKINKHKPQFFCFEDKTVPAQLHYRYLSKKETSLETWLSLERTEVKQSQSPAIVTGKTGGWITDINLALRYSEMPYYHARWRINPFAFLSAALACQDLPKPDLTTFFGLRAAFSHIDGDGMMNFTQDFPGKSRPSAEIVYKQILLKYPLPVTVGLIAARVDLKGLGKKEYLPLWKKIYALPQVEPSCHGYAHPLNWHEGKVALQVSGYKYSAVAETIGAIRLLEDKLLGGKKTIRIYLWTGDCEPDEATVLLLQNQGILSINGGNSRYDKLYNSVSFVAPLTRAVGKALQVYAPACNEHFYTKGWSENYSGFKQVIQTFVKTESPRRLLPVNIYYHFYLAERQAGLASLKDVLNWTMTQPLCWLRTSEYVKAVQDSLKLKIKKTSDNGYLISNYNSCRTLRLEVKKDKVDFGKSKNVLGFNHHAGSLYVLLTKGNNARLYLTDENPKTPYLMASTSRLREITLGSNNFRAKARLYAPGFIRLSGYRPGTNLKVSLGKKRNRRQADQQGIIEIKLPTGKGHWVEIKIES